jgi:hypothetical protein
MTNYRKTENRIQNETECGQLEKHKGELTEKTGIKRIGTDLKNWIWEQFIPCTIFAHGKNKFLSKQQSRKIFW